MKRFIRLAALAVGVLAMVGAVTPPAHATTIIETTFIAQVTVTGGIGYPVITLPTPTVPTVQCLDPLPDGNPVPNCHTHYNDHIRPATIDSRFVCTDESTHINKPGKALEHTGACSFQGSGYVTGHCGLGGGQFQGFYRDSLGQTYFFQIHFTDNFGQWAITGHVTKQSTGRTGKITGEANAMPVPEPGGQSCTTKTQRDFILIGESTIFIPTL